MRFRTHVGRALDFSHPSNRLIVGLTALTAVTAVVVWITGSDIGVLWAPAQTFLIWALVREIEPDHHLTALVAAITTAVWVLIGLEMTGVLAVGAMVVGARLVAHTTGRRPLMTDLVPIGIFAAVISFTTSGWVAGFGLAIAIYIDDRFASDHRTAAALIAALSALGATAMASLTGAFPGQLPDTRPVIVLLVGVISLAAVIREPVEPTTQVDARHRAFLDQRRLYGARSLVAVSVFAMTILAGPQALASGPLALALALALVSNEVERRSRRR